MRHGAGWPLLCPWCRSAWVLRAGPPVTHFHVLVLGVRGACGSPGAAEAQILFRAQAPVPAAPRAVPPPPGPHLPGRHLWPGAWLSRVLGLHGEEAASWGRVAARGLGLETMEHLGGGAAWDSGRQALRRIRPWSLTWQQPRVLGTRLVWGLTRDKTLCLSVFRSALFSPSTVCPGAATAPCTRTRGAWLRAGSPPGA